MGTEKMNDRPKIEWTVVKEFEKDGIVVEVSQGFIRRPRYTIRVGRRGERGTIPFIPVFVEGQGKVRVVSVADTVAELIREAEEFVREQAQIHEDNFIRERITREEREVARDGRKRKSSGYKHHRRSNDD